VQSWMGLIGVNCLLTSIGLMRCVSWIFPMQQNTSMLYWKL